MTDQRYERTFEMGPREIQAVKIAGSWQVAEERGEVAVPLRPQPRIRSARDYLWRATMGMIGLFLFGLRFVYISAPYGDHALSNMLHGFVVLIAVLVLLCGVIINRYKYFKDKERRGGFDEE